MTEKTPFQVLHLQRLRDEFGVDIGPTQTLQGAELEAWILKLKTRYKRGCWPSCAK
jgi:hypothetical protein